MKNHEREYKIVFLLKQIIPIKKVVYEHWSVGNTVQFAKYVVVLLHPVFAAYAAQI